MHLHKAEVVCQGDGKRLERRQLRLGSVSEPEDPSKEYDARETCCQAGQGRLNCRHGVALRTSRARQAILPRVGRCESQGQTPERKNRLAGEARGEGRYLRCGLEKLDDKLHVRFLERLSAQPNIGSELRKDGVSSLMIGFVHAPCYAQELRFFR